jgi:glucose/arabinose dehydrogenase
MGAGSDRRGFLRLGGGSALAAALAGVRSWQARAEAPFTIDSEQHRLRVVPVATGLEHPWGLDFLPGGVILLTERPGRLRRVRARGGLDPTPLPGVPRVVAAGQGGLLDVALHPAFARNGLVYLTYAGGVARASYTGLARGRLGPGGLSGLREIFRARPAAASSKHYGSRVVPDGRGHVFLSVGERGKMEGAQRLGQHHGKILRLREDGSVPAGNPFAGRPDARPEIWALGIRNPQGLCLDRATGRLWECEHGPMGGDELNLITRGRNYGWPVITHGRDYDGSPIGVGTHRAGLEQPVRHWTPAIAPSGLTVYRHSLFPAWAGNLFLGALKARLLVRLVLDAAGRVVHEERLLEGRIGRVRAVKAAPDGRLWLLTDEQEGALWRIEPAG